ncbi:armadillo repeat-containing protein 7 isoform X2 [Gossypium hirsutum]|uniref:Armadillo repeat-containing protein 7 isoform X2 n=1 Tax=Gossypium hirsutum TaxID=3635 RepID=A0ABM3C2U9_GOSHI|nr:armadillo repeat-containing protein 7 isoform X2 [Gossypium hirsutum]XP_040973628.1 armadillo repeat-containing protein 7 isoform X2 [Gossypium hirsutum]XP_040973629.1 armadillo repeat-containing protein 7 isoform X2 [Gossypium hirsutum]
MFTNYQRQQERTGQYGTSRQQYLQKQKKRLLQTWQTLLMIHIIILSCARLHNRTKREAYGIWNWRHLQFLYPANAAIITQCGGIPLVIKCLSSPVRNTVNYALGALYYLCNKSNREEILKPEVIDVIERYAAAQTVNASFSNLAKAFLDKHVS